MTLWENAGTPNPPDWWADVTRDVRLRFEQRVQETLAKITPYIDEEERAA
jgi:hypothetical protein